MWENRREVKLEKTLSEGLMGVIVQRIRLSIIAADNLRIQHVVSWSFT